MDFDNLASKDSLQKTTDSLKAKGYEVDVVLNKQEALEKIINIIPHKASVMNGSSVTLEQIGYIDLLKSGKTDWNDLHAKVTAENDPQKRAVLRRGATLSDFYLGSVHALTEDGQFIVASNSGSQLPHIVFNSPNLILVVSTKKIVKTLDEGIKRLEEHVLPLEDKHLMQLRNVHTALNKLLIVKGEAKSSTRKITFILVEENLGY